MGLYNINICIYNSMRNNIMKGKTDWKKNNKVSLRNFHESCDFHDLVKTQVLRMLRREHKDNHNVPIYTEYDPENPNDDYPDIWMRIKKSIIVYEIQKDTSKKWTKQIVEKYKDCDLIIVPLKEVKKEWMKELNKKDPMYSLRNVLNKYIV